MKITHWDWGLEVWRSGAVWKPGAGDLELEGWPGRPGSRMPTCETGAWRPERGLRILKAHDLRYGAGNQGLEMLKMRPGDEDLLLDWGLEVWRSGVV